MMNEEFLKQQQQSLVVKTISIKPKQFYHESNILLQYIIIHSV